LVLHYHATQRDDSPFWTQCRTTPVPEALQETIALFRRDGRYFRHGDDFFALPSWVQVMLGQRIVPAGYHPIVDEMPEANLAAFVDRVREDVVRAVEQMPTHQQFIDRYCK